MSPTDRMSQCCCFLKFPIGPTVPMFLSGRYPTGCRTDFRMSRMSQTVPTALLQSMMSQFALLPHRSWRDPS